VAGAVALRCEIVGVVRVRLDREGEALGHFDAGLLQPLHFQGIVGEKPNFADVQEIEHSRRDGKIPCINGKAESNIGRSEERRVGKEWVRTCQYRWTTEK